MSGIWYIVGIYTTYEVIYSEVGGKLEYIKYRDLAISGYFDPLIAKSRIQDDVLQY